MVVASTGTAGAWSLVAERWEPARHRTLWWFTAGAHVSVAVQAVLGVVLVAGEDRSAPQFHTFYGFIALIAVAIIHSYRQQMRHRLYQLYGFGGLFVMGLALRAMFLRA